MGLVRFAPLDVILDNNNVVQTDLIFISYELFFEGFAGDTIKSKVLSGLEISIEDIFKKDW